MPAPLVFRFSNFRFSSLDDVSFRGWFLPKESGLFFCRTNFDARVFYRSVSDLYISRIWFPLCCAAVALIFA